MKILYDRSPMFFIQPGFSMPWIQRSPDDKDHNYVVESTEAQLREIYPPIHGVTHNIKTWVDKRSLLRINQSLVPSPMGMGYPKIEIPCPSVTKILDVVHPMEKNAGYQKWVSFVGEEQANRIKLMSANRGKTFHKVCEIFIVRNMENYNSTTPDQYSLGRFVHFHPYRNNPDIDVLLNQVKFFLDDFTFHMLEVPIISPIRYIAGTPDMVGTFNGKFSIVDFKTFENDPKTDVMDEKIDKWFLQMGGYLTILDHILCEDSRRKHPQRPITPDQIYLLYNNILPTTGIIIGSSLNYGPLIVEKSLIPYARRFVDILNIYDEKFCEREE